MLPKEKPGRGLNENKSKSSEERRDIKGKSVSLGIKKGAEIDKKSFLYDSYKFSESKVVWTYLQNSAWCAFPIWHNDFEFWISSALTTGSAVQFKPSARNKWKIC